MATVTPTYNGSVSSQDGSVVQWTWTLTTANTDGAPFEYTEYADVCFTATGTWGGATMTIEGSNDASTFMALSNAAGGTAATATANKAVTIIERPRYMRPNLTTAGTGASVTVICTARRANPLRT